MHSLRMISTCVCVAAVGMCLLAQPATSMRKPLDLHSAIALSQAHLYGTTGLTARADRTSPVADVLLLVSQAQWTTVRARLAARGMAIAFEDARSGYIRATVPRDDVRVLFEWQEIDAVRVDGLAGFDTRLQPQILRTSLGFREAGDPERTPPEVEEAPPVTSTSALPVLTAENARRYPINTDQDMGVTEFRATHPTFDGRGVGIGVIESTWLPIDQPAFAEARALDGTQRRKVLRYLDYPSARSEDLAAPFSDWFECQSAICQVGGRTIRLPGPGQYKVADFALLSPYPPACGGKARFSILQRQDTRRLYVDTNRDFDFLDEPAMVDFNDAAWDTRSIASLQCGRGQSVKTVVTVDTDGKSVRLHPFSHRHATMTSTVAAGSEVQANLGVGVAPNASLVAVDYGPNRLLSQTLEGAITLARDPDVDVLFAALVIQTPLGTSDSFDTRAFDRISEAYNKPILISAGNYSAAVASTPVPSGRLTMAVGQYISAATAEARLGVRRPEVSVVASTVGPAWDGASRPDFVVASKRIAAFPCVQGKRAYSNQFDLPPCYTISGGTSAASPSAAGLVALLVSAAKQRGFTPSVADIRDALIASARAMPGLPIHAQGAGLINVSRAWEYLERRSRPTTLSVEGELRHGLVDLLGAHRPKGLFLMARSDDSQTLTLTVRVPNGKGIGRLSVGSQGDLDVGVEGQLDTSVSARLPVRITPPPLGRVASSWITFADASGVSVGRALATAVRPAPLEAPAYEYAWKEDVEIESLRGTVVAVPPGASGVLIEVDRLRGDVEPMVSSPLGALVLPRAFWSGSSFSTARMHAPGHYAGVLIDPAGGDWGIANVDYSTIRDNLPKRLERVSVAVRMTAFRTLCSLLQRAVRGPLERVRVAVDDIFAKPVNGGVLLAPAIVQTERFALRDEFERRPVTIDVKPGTALFHVEIRNQDSDSVMLQLFDCTQGHCIPVTQTVPGDPSPALNVRQPLAGVWQVFVVPVRAVQKAMNVEIAITQAIEANLTTLAPLIETRRSNGQVFEGEVPIAKDASGYVLLRTDERAKVNKEGWGAISVCAVHNPANSR